MKILGSDHSKWKLLKKAIEQYVAPELSEILYRVGSNFFWVSEKKAAEELWWYVWCFFLIFFFVNFRNLSVVMSAQESRNIPKTKKDKHARCYVLYLN